MYCAVCRARPMDFSSRIDDGKLQTMFQQPQQDLASCPEFHEFRQHQLDGFLNSTIRVFLQSLILGLDIAGRSRHN